jgi:hypothetical protein
MVIEALNKLNTELKIRGFSQLTVRNYSFFVNKFILKANKPVEQLTQDDARNYLAEMFEDKSKNTIMLAAAALKFFYAEILKKDFGEIKMPKKDKRLPEVLTRDEVSKLINSAETRKSRLILSLLYSSGLRVSELVNLKPQDINFAENIGWVRGGYLFLSNVEIINLYSCLFSIRIVTSDSSSSNATDEIEVTLKPSFERKLICSVTESLSGGSFTELDLFKNKFFLLKSLYSVQGSGGTEEIPFFCITFAKFID